ncbi:MAG: isoprenylcysteine carboxylmethyltransferase family protein, partial [Pseudomonadota bacterium]
AVVLDRVLPLPFARGSAADILAGVGFVFIVLAAALYALSARELRRHNTAILPTKAADRLVTTGPFAITRNPIYLANVVVVSGMALITGNLWMLGAAFLCGLLEYHLAIKREEAHLEHKFGKAWRDYRKKVRRWV